jgi:arginine utilization protein RocB
MEYDLALRIGVPAERIIFNGPYKQLSDFKRKNVGNSPQIEWGPTGKMNHRIVELLYRLYSRINSLLALITRVEILFYVQLECCLQAIDHAW